jgi:hypothetical protein
MVLAVVGPVAAKPKTVLRTLVKRLFDLLGICGPCPSFCLGVVGEEVTVEGSTVLERLKRAKTVFFLCGGGGRGV